MQHAKLDVTFRFHASTNTWVHLDRICCHQCDNQMITSIRTQTCSTFFFFSCPAIRQGDHRVSRRRPVHRMNLSTASGSLCSQGRRRRGVTVSAGMWPRRADRAAWYFRQLHMTCSMSSATPHSGHRPSVSSLFHLNRGPGVDLLEVGGAAPRRVLTTPFRTSGGAHPWPSGGCAPGAQWCAMCLTTHSDTHLGWPPSSTEGRSLCLVKAGDARRSQLRPLAHSRRCPRGQGSIPLGQFVTVC